MYKKFFMGIAAMAALTLVSCSSDDLDSFSDNSSKNEAISFDGYLGRSAVAVNGSRGSVLDKTQLQNSTAGFGVFGKYNAGAGQTSNPDFFKNQKVTYSNKKWTYSPLKYWPTNGQIDFLAYAPYNAGKVKNTYSLDFTVPSTSAEQKDLLWAHADNQTKADKTVKFTFNHALAKIGYNVKTSVTGATITLNRIKLAGSLDGKTKAFYKEGTIDLSKSFDDSDENLWAISPSVEKQDFDWFSGDQPLTTPYKTPAADYLFVIPQEFSTGTELYVIVDYTISYNDVAIANMKSTVSSKISKKFVHGKEYTINLTIGLTKIDFDVTDVNGWTTEADGKGDIDSWDDIEHK